MLGRVSRPLVATLGRVSVDFVGVTARMPEPDADAELDRISVQVGGSAAIAVGTAVALGCAGRIGARLADDVLGSYALRALATAGIDTRCVRQVDRHLSPLSFAGLTRDHRERLCFRSDGDIGELEPLDLEPLDLLQDAAVLLVDGRYPPLQAHIARIARGRGVPVVVDGSALRDGTEELIALADVLLCSERLATELAPRNQLGESLWKLARLGPRAVVITLGDAGCIGLHDGAILEQAAPAVEAMDAANAGDVFAGAFVTGLVGELGFARCLELACTAAALSCTELGPWAGIPERDRVLEHMRRRS